MSLDFTTPQSKDEAALRRDAGKLRYDLLPWDAMDELVRVYTVGAAKYEDNNWLKGMSWGRCVGAMFRHMSRWALGEERDPETNCYHLAHAMWNAMALLTYSMRGLGTDDRIKIAGKETVQ